MSRIYLDHAATTPLLPEVRDAMLPWLSESFHNPSSLYEGARKARMAIDESREVVASALHCLPGEVVFTGSGTEAANLAVIGTALAYRDSARRRILLSAAEHHCVLSCSELLQSLGFIVELLPVLADAALDFDALSATIDEDVLLVCAMHANNETGAITDANRVFEICNAQGALYFCDAVQSVTVLDIPRADMLSVSAHKLNGPKGCGALYVRAGLKPQPIAIGGGQEREVRAGTENVAGIVGFAEAVKRAEEIQERNTKTLAARDAFEYAIREFATPTMSDKRLPAISQLRISGADAQTVLIKLDKLGVDASSGAACSSGSIEPSHVVMAMGYSAKIAIEYLRFSFGHESTIEEALRAAEILRVCVS